MNFKKHLESLNYTPSTINRYLAWERSFLRYCRGKLPAHLSEVELLEYLESQRVGRSTLGLLIGRLRRYYRYLEVPFPLANFRLKGKPQASEPQLLKREQVRQLVSAFCSPPGRELKHKVGLALLAHQGLATGDLPELLAHHINLVDGTLTVPDQTRRASRTLALEASQVLHLSQLLQTKLPSDTLLDYQSEKQASNRHEHWKRELRRLAADLNLPFDNLQQLRSSRIATWIAEVGLIRAQYLAGHRSVVATKGYEQIDSEALRNSFEQYHPFYAKK